MVIMIYLSLCSFRSGAYIVMETLILQIESDGYLKPADLVKTLREQRMAMVQTEEQFVFSCKTALDYFDQTLRKRK